MAIEGRMLVRKHAKETVRMCCCFLFIDHVNWLRRIVLTSHRKTAVDFLWQVVRPSHLEPQFVYP